MPPCIPHCCLFSQTISYTITPFLVSKAEALIIITGFAQLAALSATVARRVQSRACLLGAKLKALIISSLR